MFATGSIGSVSCGCGIGIYHSWVSHMGGLLCICFCSATDVVECLRHERPDTASGPRSQILQHQLHDRAKPNKIASAVLTSCESRHVCDVKRKGVMCCSFVFMRVNKLECVHPPQCSCCPVIDVVAARLGTVQFRVCGRLRMQRERLWTLLQVKEIYA